VGAEVEKEYEKDQTAMDSVKRRNRLFILLFELNSIV
jgi:hypothetical protein